MQAFFILRFLYIIIFYYKMVDRNIECSYTKKLYFKMEILSRFAGKVLDMKVVRNIGITRLAFHIPTHFYLLTLTKNWQIWWKQKVEPGLLSTWLHLSIIFLNYELCFKISFEGLCQVIRKERKCMLIHLPK